MEPIRKLSPRLNSTRNRACNFCGRQRHWYGKKVDLVFEPFYRSQNAKVIKGSGIGLSLVKSIFELHNLRFDVKSVKNKGTRFYIYFSTHNDKLPTSIKETVAHEKHRNLILGMLMVLILAAQAIWVGDILQNRRLMMM